MTRANKPTLEDAIREALREATKPGAQSIRSVSRAAGVAHPSLIRFVRGDQSLRLDAAARLAAHLGIEAVRAKRSTGRSRKGGRA